MRNDTNEYPTIFFADDDQDDRELVEDAFSRLSPGARFTAFESGRDLLIHLRSLEGPQGRPNLILLDVNMPGLNGMEVLQQIRAMKGFEDSRVVLFTTSVGKEEHAASRRYNATVEKKPCSYTGFLEVVAAWLHPMQDCPTTPVPIVHHPAPVFQPRF